MNLYYPPSPEESTRHIAGPRGHLGDEWMSRPGGGSNEEMRLRWQRGLHASSETGDL